MNTFRQKYAGIIVHLNPTNSLLVLFISMRWQKSLSEDEIRAHDGYIRTQLLRIFVEIYENASGNLASTLRKAICRVDEVLNS